MSDLNLDKILNIYNYFDGIMITDEKGVIKYYTNFRTDVYSLQLDQIVGKTVLEIHPELTEEQSTIMQVLKTGQPIYDRVEHLTTDVYKRKGISTALLLYFQGFFGFRQTIRSHRRISAPASC